MKNAAWAFAALSPLAILFTLNFDWSDWQLWASVPAMIWCLMLYPEDGK
jgi:hypothetical protein